MPQPFDYSLSVPNPANAVLAGVQQGAGLFQGMQQAKQAAIETRGAQQALDRKTAFQADLAKINEKPSAAGTVSLLRKYPEFGALLKETITAQSDEEKQQNISDANAVLMAINAGKTDVAKEELARQAEALRNGGREKEAEARERFSKIIDISPDTARTSGSMYLAEMMGHENYVKAYTEIEKSRRERDLEGATLSEAESKAEKAAVESQFAESQAVADLEKKGWDVKKIQSDIQVQRENTRIAAMNSALAKETNEQRKQLLQSKLNDAQIKRDATVRERVANAESARSQIDNFLNTAQRALPLDSNKESKTYNPNGTPLSVIGNATGPVDSRLFTLRQSTADFEALVETLGSQSFLAQVPNLKGMGALSNAEGEKLQSALQSFRLSQSPERFTNNLRQAQRLLLKARANVSSRFGVPETIPDTPNAEPGDPELEALLDEYGAGAAPVQ